MACPECQSDEISPEGVCLICGYQLSKEDAEAEAKSAEASEPGHPGPIEVDYSEKEPEPQEKSEVPPWRQQLSQRLHEIKQKKESSAAAQQERKPAAIPAAQPKPADNLTSLQERLKKVPVRKPQAPIVPPPRQKTLTPLPEPPAPQSIAAPAAPPPDSQEIRNIIDSAVLRQTTQPAEPPVPHMHVIAREPERAPDDEGKLILLSRTLSGLIDLIVVVLCTGVLVIAADYFSGIVALDYISLIMFALVFLLIFFLYSLLFLTSCNQTIGMMITDLRVIRADEKRPKVGQVIGRCGGFLLSLGFAGLGLLSGIFDRDCACFHDHISGTRVVRS